MPDRADKSLLVLGLVLYFAGTIAVNVLGATTKIDSAIDITHWLMLSGAALTIPFAARLPRNGIALLGGPMLLVGTVLIVGMCVIDLVFWSLPDPALQAEVARELTATPALWLPFMDFSGWVFIPALALASIVYWRRSRLGVVLTHIGAAAILVLPIWSNPYGFFLILLGYLFCIRGDVKGDAVSRRLSAGSSKV